MRRSAIPTIAHRLAILCYIAFALFPLFWLLKVSVTPNDLLYSEGVRMWPSHATLDHYRYVIAVSYTHLTLPTILRV